MQILIIAEKYEEFSALEQILAPKGYTLLYSSKKEDFYLIIRKHGIRIIILQATKEETEDFIMLRDIKNFDPLLEIIIIGPPIPSLKLIEAINFGANDYLEEPLKEAAILSLLGKIKEKMLLRKETFQLEKRLREKYIFEGMVSRNYYMFEVFSLIERLARYSTSVLITGPTGTGKEMVARAIHNLSQRRDKKLIVCDCTAVPESLFESELFGFEKGAFTGAEKSKAGLFSEADKGTIFLDEIGEVPISIQTKLLRVLEEHQFRPLGSNQMIQIDVRVICASNKDLREKIKTGTFREDLFHRINVAEIRLPPLMERKEDIHLLCSYFLDRYNERFKKNIRGISQRAKKVLMKYDWPGNVRELENLIQRTVMLCREQFIDIKDLPENFLKYQEREEAESLPYPFTHLSLEEIEKKHILEILRAANYNKKKSAGMLGLTRQALYRRLKKLNLPF